MTETSEPFATWCIVELLGHRRAAGHLQEVQIAGAGFLRLDIPATDGHPAQTQFIAPGSVYALHPTTQDLATAAAARFRPIPVHAWELAPALPAGGDTKPDDDAWPDNHDDPDDDGPF